ncbi:MAG: hypothetical protein ACR2IE_18240 [Candidatus Sumerlaeaceae bacterium]
MTARSVHLVARNRFSLWVILVPLVFLLLALLSSDSTLTSNDGAHFVLTRSLVRTGSPHIDGFLWYTLNTDYSIFKGHYFSDRPPGTAFLCCPFLALWDAAAGVIPSMREIPAARVSTVFANLAGAIGAALMYWVLGLWGCTKMIALAASLLTLFGTLMLRYSLFMFSHVLSADCLLLALGLATPLFMQPPMLNRQGVLQLLLLGFVLGYFVVIEYTGALLGVLLVGFLVASWLRNEGAGAWRLHLARMGLLAGAGFAGVLPLLIYNCVCFGNPFTTAYSYHAKFDWAGSFATTFTHSPVRGLGGLLFGNGEVAFPLLTHSPWLWLCPIGIVAAVHRGYRMQVALLGSFVVVFGLLMGAHRTYWGGGTRDARYLVAVLPGFALLSGLAIDSIRRLRRPLQLVVMPTVLLLGGISVIMHLSDHYHLLRRGNETPLPDAMGERVVEILQTLLPGLKHLGLLLSAACITLMTTMVVGLATTSLRRRVVST